MMDQANELRQLVAESRGHADTSRRVGMTLVAGGKPRTGTTCVAVALTQALAELNKPATLVDLERLDASQPRESIHKTWLLNGQDHWLVVDGGNRICNTAPALLLRAQSLLLVTTADATAVASTFAVLKAMIVQRQPSDAPPLVSLVVNRVDETRAIEIGSRFSNAAKRFLGMDVGLTCHVAEGGLQAAPAEPSDASPIRARYAVPRQLAAVAARLTTSFPKRINNHFH